MLVIAVNLKKHATNLRQDEHTLTLNFNLTVYAKKSEDSARPHFRL